MVVVDDKDIIRGLGYVTLYSAYFEEEIDRCVEALKSVKGAPSGNEPGPQGSASRKLEYCLEQSRHVGIDTLEITSQVFKGGKDLLKQRNDVVHGRIYAQDQGGDIRRSGRLRVPDRPITSAELYTLANEFHQATIMASQIADFYIPDAENERPGDQEVLVTPSDTAHVDVLAYARQAYRQFWTGTPEVSASTRESQAVCSQWQESLRALDPERFASEVRISDTFRERIDLIDRATSTAYEMKVSGKNPAHEFFKDIFKISEHNLSGGGGIQRLVFLTDGSGVRRLQGGLGRSLIENSHDLGFEVTLASLDSE